VLQSTQIQPTEPKGTTLSDTYSKMDDNLAVRIATGHTPNETDVDPFTFLEVSINGGDIDTVRTIALDLLGGVERQIGAQ
jgi:hypothetical protein